MFEYLRVKIVARRLGLQDKGEMGPTLSQPLSQHDYSGIGVWLVPEHCNAPVRIGIIKKEGWVVYYCLKCKKIVGRPKWWRENTL